MKRILRTEHFRVEDQVPSEERRPNVKINHPAGKGNLSRVEEAFAQVCRAFFPLWNRGAQWRVCSQKILDMAMRKTPENRIRRTVEIRGRGCPQAFVHSRTTQAKGQDDEPNNIP